MSALATAFDPTRLLTAAGIEPDPWQEDLLLEPWDRALLLCARQTGKSTATAALALHTALFQTDALVLILAPARRQSKELLAKVWGLYRDVGRPVRVDNRSELRVRFDNGSRIVALPGTEKTVRGFSAVDLIIADEAARVDDELYTAVRPMLAVSDGRLVGLSTPFGKRGWFYESWTDSEQADWHRVKVTGPECPRLSGEFLEQERREIGSWMYRQEYLCHPARAEVCMTDGSTRRMGNLSVGDTVLWSDGEAVRGCAVVAKRQTGVKQLMEVTAETGQKVEATPDHRVKVKGSRVPLSETDALEFVFARPYPTESSAALARLVGFNLGDGTVCDRNPRMDAYFYGSEKADLEWVTRDLVNAGLYDQPPEVRFKEGAREAFDSYQVGAYGSAAERLCEAGCVTGRKTEAAFDVPTWIRRGRDEVKREFVAALWGAEGSSPVATHDTGKNCNAPVLSMHNRAGSPFLSTVAEMHRELGVEVSVRSAGEDGKTLQVIGGKEGYRDFYRRIGYRYAVEKERKAWLWSHYLSAQLYEATDRIRRVRERNEAGESLASISRDMGKEKGWAWALLNRDYDAPEAGRGFPSFEEWVGDRWNGHALTLSVERRSLMPPEPVYNITVSSPDHSYLLASGLDNYNCEFVDPVGQMFKTSEIEEAFDPDVDPLFETEDTAAGAAAADPIDPDIDPLEV